MGVAVVGAGVAGHGHAAAFACDARTRLVGVADIVEDRAARLQRRVGAGFSTPRYEDLLERSDVELVSVCTPNALHARVSIDAIRAGKHVLCEKPLAIPLEQACAIADATSDARDQWVSCVYQHRADAAVRRTRWLLDNGFPSNVSAIRVTARTSRSADYFRGAHGTHDGDGGGALLVQGIHMVDLLIWLAGDAVSVSALTDTRVHSIEVEDTMVGWVKMASGAVATIECTTYAARDEYRIELLGDHQSLHLSYLPGRGRVWQLGVVSSQGHALDELREEAERALPSSVPPRPVLFAAFAGRRLLGRDGRSRHLGHGPFIRHCLDSLQSESAPPVPPVEAIRSLELALAFYRSAHTGMTVDLPLVATDALV